jgi:hypothetical protein
VDQRQTTNQSFVCPMHSDVRQPNPGKCSKCGMDLLPEGTRFALLRHMMSRPLHVVIMAVVMLLVMAVLMMAMTP